jgi:AcrR family transcriptional regulator
MSISTAPARASKRRPYRLGKRAEMQERTRRRIAEAALELHGTLGPARTSIAQIAERAGVQRHTFYAHFPDEWSLVEACSGLAFERDPLPDVERWVAFAPGPDRIRRGLEELYAWYQRNEQLTSCVLRDAEFHDLTRVAAEMRMGATFRRMRELLCECIGEQGCALVELALDFHCWRVLARSHTPPDAAELMAKAAGGSA